MKIKVIGSGSIWTKYNSASYLIDDNILVDMPNGMCKYLFRINKKPNDIEYVLLTHFHGDHYFDMPFFYLLKSKSENKNIKVFCSKEGKNKIKKILKLSFPNSTSKILKEINLVYNFNKNFSISGYKIDKYLVDHGRMKPAYAYIFMKNGKKVGFTGDTSLCQNVEYMANCCNYLFCDCMYINGTSKHMGIDNIKYLAKKYQNCKFVVSHLEDNTRNSLQKENVNNVIVPSDYDEFII